MWKQTENTFNTKNKRENDRHKDKEIKTVRDKRQHTVPNITSQLTNLPTAQMAVSNHTAVLRALREDSVTSAQTVNRPPLNWYDITTKFRVIAMFATDSKPTGYSSDDM
jgi:hypothetical protein